jgi:cytochrome c5
MEMLRPVSALFVLAALACATARAAEAPRSGEQTVRQVCSACHGAGLFGAPRIGNAQAWSARLRAAGSVDGLLASAANGKNSMPPRGGDAELSDAELRAAIESMLAQSGVR